MLDCIKEAVITQISNVMKIHSVEAELSYAEEQTDGRTDKPTDIHDEANTLFLLFGESAGKAKHL